MTSWPRDAAAPDAIDIAIRQLDRLTEIAAGTGNDALVREASDERQRLADARFFVACVGQFKRGKSTLLNALVGRSVLPVGVTPVTSVVTILRYGVEEVAEVQFTGGRRERITLEQMPTLVDERRNPGNRHGVAAVEVSLPADILREGLCLVDTPGLGSISAANTAATRAFVPHVDVALVVVGPDPPLSGVELELVCEVAAEVTRTVVVLNKADQVSAAQQEEVVSFTRSAIESRLGRAPERIFVVSARERLDLSAATRDWDDLVAELQQLRGVARQPLLAAAASRATRRLGRRLLAELREHEAALRKPLAETEARLARLGTALADVDRSLRDLHYLFDATEADLSTIFARQRVEFVGRAQPEVARKLEQWVQDRLRTDGRRHLREAALTEARRLAEAAVGGWLAEIEPAAEALYRQATARFAHLTHEFLARVAGDADRTPPDEVEPSAGFRLNRQYYFASLMHLTAAGPLTSIGDLAATSRRLEQRVAHAALIYLGQLLRVNSHRVEYDFKERTRESRRQMERHVRARLTEAVATAERALALASSTQRMNEAELGGRLEGLRRACEEVSGLAGAS